MGAGDQTSEAPTVRDTVIDFLRRFGTTSTFANLGSIEFPMFRNFQTAFRYIRSGVLDLLAHPIRARFVTPSTRQPRPRVTPSSLGSVAFVLQTHAAIRKRGHLVVAEAPSARATMQAHLPITQFEGFYTMDSRELGYSMPAAAGISLAIGLIGDGSGLYSMQAL